MLFSNNQACLIPANIPILLLSFLEGMSEALPAKVSFDGYVCDRKKRTSLFRRKKAEMKGEKFYCIGTRFDLRRWQFG
jgi:hypothetical protein